VTPEQTLLGRARAARPTVVLVGGAGDDLPALAARLEGEGIGRPVVVGPGGVEPAGDGRLQDLAVRLRERWPERVRDGIHALDLAAEPLLFGAGLLLTGQAQVLLAGAGVRAHEVEDVFRWILGPERATRGRGAVRYVVATDGRLLTTVTPDTAGPLDARGLAVLALAAVGHRGRALGDPVRAAFLVPPPTQDASHADAELAVAEFRALAPGLDAAVEWGWNGGADGGRFRPRPNVLIFPDPVSGHLAHGLLRDAAAARILGPLFPEERWVVAGLTGETAAEDIVAVAAVAAAGLRGG
jgi:phosphotransacetylase